MMLLGVTFWTLFPYLLTSVSAHTLNATSTHSTPASASSSIGASSSTKDVSSSSPPSSSSSPPSSSPSLSSSASASSPTSSAIPTSPFKPGTKNPKRGIAFASDNTDDILNANQTKGAITWIYNWADLPPAYISQSKLKYIPMQWGSGNIVELASAISAQGADTILTFNEPDFSSESNIKASDAVQLWMQFIEPLKQEGVRLGGPAVTAAPSGKQWLTEFVSGCHNCSIDFLPLHWYGSGTDGFFSYIWDIHTTFPQFPIWITEYAELSDNDTVVLNFMNDTINEMDTLDWVERYSWFGFFRPEQDVHYNMLQEDGSLNDLGQLYIGAKTVHTSNRTTGPQYQTLSPSDLPGQPLVTSWPQQSSAKPITSWSLLPLPILIVSIVLGAFVTLA